MASLQAAQLRAHVSSICGLPRACGSWNRAVRPPGTGGKRAVRRCRLGRSRQVSEVLRVQQAGRAADPFDDFGAGQGGVASASCPGPGSQVMPVGAGQVRVGAEHLGADRNFWDQCKPVRAGRPRRAVEYVVGGEHRRVPAGIPSCSATALQLGGSLLAFDDVRQQAVRQRQLVEHVGDTGRCGCQERVRSVDCPQMRPSGGRTAAPQVGGCRRLIRSGCSAASSTACGSQQSADRCCLNSSWRGPSNFGAG